MIVNRKTRAVISKIKNNMNIAADIQKRISAAFFVVEESMEEYKLELKQIVDYPRCRMYRQFIQGLIGNMNLRVGKESYLYYYTVLCCFANFRTSYHRVKGVTYMIEPPCTDPYVWWCERSTHQLMVSFLLDFEKNA